MPATPRRKACLPCATSKRRCDKGVPECQRCLDRDVDCAYPQPKRRRRDAATGTAVTCNLEAEGTALQPFYGQNHGVGNAPGNENGNGLDVDAVDWSAVSGVDLAIDQGLDMDLAMDFTLSDMLQPPSMFSMNTSMSIPPVPLPVPTLTWPTLPPTPFQQTSSQKDNIPQYRNINITSNDCPCPWSWLLQDSTWTLDHCAPDPVCTTFIELEPFISDVESMLKDWVTKGHNGFIHARLYEKGMPGCLQDAFAMFAAYTAQRPRTAGVKETLLRIAEAKMGALVYAESMGNVDSKSGSGTESILGMGIVGDRDQEQHLRDTLSRVQALFTYIFILLFDGSVRARGAAERQVPVLRAWLKQLWVLAKSYSWMAHAGTHDVPVPVPDTPHHHANSDSDSTPNLNPNPTPTPQFPQPDSLSTPDPSQPQPQPLNSALAPSPSSSPSPTPSPEADPDSTITTTDQSPTPSLSFTQATSLWHLYILTESLRRTYLVIDTTLNLYTVMKDGWAECGGAVILSARKALWDAERVGEWWGVVNYSGEGGGEGRGMDKDEWKSKGPLMVSSKMPGAVIDECKADEVDGFVRLYWRFVVGRDRVEWWEGRDQGRDADGV